MLAGRYRPLLQHLAVLPSEQRACVLSFAELAAILGSPLAVSARLNGWYWTAGPVARANWIRDGWDARLDRGDRAVTFTRLAR
jgi:hypothetical protein